MTKMKQNYMANIIMNISGTVCNLIFTILDSANLFSFGGGGGGDHPHQIIEIISLKASAHSDLVGFKK